MYHTSILTGCAFPSLITTLEDYLGSYLERFTNLMRRLDKRKNSQNSWSILQQSLTLNQTCGDLILQLEQLDITLSIDFLERTKNFLGDHEKGRVLDQHHIFLLDSSSTSKLYGFHEKVQEGELIAQILCMVSFAEVQCHDMQSHKNSENYKVLSVMVFSAVL